MSKRVDRDATCEIEVALPGLGYQPAAFTSLKCQWRSCEGFKKGRSAHFMQLRSFRSVTIKIAAQRAAKASLYRPLKEVCQIKRARNLPLRNFTCLGGDQVGENRKN